MKKLDNYLDLCTQVYDLSKPVPAKDSYDFYRKYVANAKGPILEPMCGTGRMLLPFLEEGFNVQGFDASQNMLSALHEKAKLKNLKPDVWQGFLEEMDRSEKYGFIFIPFGSLGLIPDLKTVHLCLKKIYDHLMEDGLFVFEVETLKSVPDQFNIWDGSVWERADGKTIILSGLPLPLKDNVGTIICRYELVDGNSLIQTEIEKYSIRLYEPGPLKEMLKAVGFRDIKIYKMFDKTKAPDAEDTEMVVECRK